MARSLKVANLTRAVAMILALDDRFAFLAEFARGLFGLGQIIRREPGANLFVAHQKERVVLRQIGGLEETARGGQEQIGRLREQFGVW